MNSDLISRKAAIEAMEESEWGYLWECEQVINVVKDLPPAEPEQKWIPVSERLPKDSERVLITHKGGVSFGWYNGRYWERGAPTNHRPLQTVIAWMPLPKPYKENKEMIHG